VITVSGWGLSQCGTDWHWAEDWGQLVDLYGKSLLVLGIGRKRVREHTLAWSCAVIEDLLFV